MLKEASLLTTSLSADSLRLCAFNFALRQSSLKSLATNPDVLCEIWSINKHPRFFHTYLEIEDYQGDVNCIIFDDGLLLVLLLSFSIITLQFHFV